jgi:hypothetical protein
MIVIGQDTTAYLINNEHITKHLLVTVTVPRTFRHNGRRVAEIRSAAGELSAFRTRLCVNSIDPQAIAAEKSVGVGSKKSVSPFRVRPPVWRVLPLHHVLTIFLIFLFILNQLRRYPGRS